MKEIIAYETEDGCRFLYKKDALDHEREQRVIRALYQGEMAEDFYIKDEVIKVAKHLIKHRQVYIAALLHGEKK